MTYPEAAIPSSRSTAIKQVNKNQRGFILSTIVAAFEAYGAALCGHLAIDPAAVSPVDSTAPKPASNAPCDSRIEIFVTAA